MSQNITWLGASYSDVPAVTLPKTGGGTARFTDATPTTAVESDVSSGKIFVKADGSLGTGTASGGGGDTVFVVTLSWDSQESMYVPDCTYAQAYSAYQAGKTVAFECDEDNGYAPYYGVYSEDDSCFVYSVLKYNDSSSPSYHWGYQIYAYFWTSEGVELDDNQIIYSMDGATAIAADVTTGKYFFNANGLQVGTNQGGGGASMNVQVAAGVNRVNTTTYSAVSGQSLTVAKTGTYDVYWTGYRSSTSGTNGTQLYIDNTAYGTAQTTFSNNGQAVHLTGVSLTKDQVITLRARARTTSYYMYGGNLTIVQTA